MVGRITAASGRNTQYVAAAAIGLFLSMRSPTAKPLPWLPGPRRATAGRASRPHSLTQRVAPPPTGDAAAVRGCDCGYRSPKDPQIAAEAEAPDIFQIHGQFCVHDVALVGLVDVTHECGLLVEVGDLGWTRNTRPDGQHFALGLAPQIHVDGRLRSGPNQGHLTKDHVDELRQLIQARAPQEGPHPGDAGIKRSRHRRANAGRARYHGAELPHGEGRSMASNTPAPWKTGPVESRTTARPTRTLIGLRMTKAIKPSPMSINRLTAACQGRISVPLPAADAGENVQQRVRYPVKLDVGHARPDGQGDRPFVDSLSRREVPRLVSERALVVGVKVQGNEVDGCPNARIGQAADDFGPSD